VKIKNKDFSKLSNEKQLKVLGYLNKRYPELNFTSNNDLLEVRPMAVWTELSEREQNFVLAEIHGLIAGVGL
jgi:hypothetical protein